MFKIDTLMFWFDHRVASPSTRYKTATEIIPETLKLENSDMPRLMKIVNV